MGFLLLFPDTMICTCCCSTLDNIITYLYRRVSRAGKHRRNHAGVPPEGDNCLRVLEVQPEVMRQVRIPAFDHHPNEGSIFLFIADIIDYFERHHVR